MIAKINKVDGHLELKAESKEEEKQLKEWYNKTYSNFDKLCDFLVWIDE